MGTYISSYGFSNIDSTNLKAVFDSAKKTTIITE